MRGFDAVAIAGEEVVDTYHLVPVGQETTRQVTPDETSCSSQ